MGGREHTCVLCMAMHACLLICMVLLHGRTDIQVSAGTDGPGVDARWRSERRPHVGRGEDVDFD